MPINRARCRDLVSHPGGFTLPFTPAALLAAAWHRSKAAAVLGGVSELGAVLEDRIWMFGGQGLDAEPCRL